MFEFKRILQVNTFFYDMCICESYIVGYSYTFHTHFVKLLILFLLKKPLYKVLPATSRQRIKNQ